LDAEQLVDVEVSGVQGIDDGLRFHDAGFEVPESTFEAIDASLTAGGVTLLITSVGTVVVVADMTRLCHFRTRLK
jgi:hypothetical protein